jgi:prepilin-type N-terminal cleavage/methylation domain-containing protein
MKKNGFTLIELLVVIVILAILITLGSKGLRNARISAKKAQARIEMKSIETAIKAYVNKYGELPAEHGKTVGVDLRDEPSSIVSEGIISILTKADDMDAEYNPAEMVFLEPQGDGSDGRFLDPWGYQYRIALDTDYDDRVDINGEIVRRKVALVSVGLFHLRGIGSTNDLIKSWQ